jgi:hypothetical protein
MSEPLADQVMLRMDQATDLYNRDGVMVKNPARCESFWNRNIAWIGIDSYEDS